MSDDPSRLTRRRVLMQLGLTATSIYAAPTLLDLSGARASSASFSAPSRPVRARRAAPPPRPEIVVATQSVADVDAIAAQGYTVLDRDRLGIVDVELVRFQVPAVLTIEAARAQIAQLVPTALFDLNHIYEPGEMPCGPDGCVAFELVGWQPETTACPAGTTIGMIDTNVNVDHAALAGVDIETLAVLGEGRQPATAVHGTAVAVLLAGRSDTRTPGLLDNARVIAAEAFHRGANGDLADAFDVARAIDRLVGRDVNIINLSFAGPENAVLRQVVDAAKARDVIMVAAAGNGGPNADPLFPAGYEAVVAVTAVDRETRVYRRANSGPQVDFAAPGVNLWTAASVSGGRYRSGTSYAAPFVTAALAVARAADPQRSGDDLIADLAQTARDLGEDGRDETFGWGLVQSAGRCAAP
jgi:subtilisin family serine protease